jgi:hypothetical protein
MELVDTLVQGEGEVQVDLTLMRQALLVQADQVVVVVVVVMEALMVVV